ncbi:MAG TPA: hypothetical protein VFS20_03070 [Longimicrobium sp.]|nr:hypothetical protein [Longimicrobium sp.]
MKKLTLDVADLRVASFETDDKPVAVNAITGTVCLTRQTLYDTCCSPTGD